MSTSITVNVGPAGQVHVKRHARQVGQFKSGSPARSYVSSTDADVDNTPGSFAEAMGADQGVDQNPFSSQFEGIVKNMRDHESTDGNIVKGTSLEESTFLQHEPTVGQVTSDRHDFEQSRDESFMQTQDRPLLAPVEDALSNEARELPEQAGEARTKLSDFGKGVGEKLGSFFKPSGDTGEAATPELKAAQEEREQARRRKQAADDRFKLALKKRAERTGAPLVNLGTKIENTESGFIENLSSSLEGE